MSDRLREARAILGLIEDSENEQDARSKLELAGYSEEEAEALLDACLEVLYLANG